MKKQLEIIFIIFSISFILFLSGSAITELFNPDYSNIDRPYLDDLSDRLSFFERIKNW